MLKGQAEDRSLAIAAWVLAVSYGVGAPVTALAEWRGQVLSDRFDLPAELIYLTCAIQIVCTPAVLVRPFAPWAALALTAVTLGAIGAHLSIGSPLTAITAVVYTAVQAWFGIRSWQSGRGATVGRSEP
jgi:hypothetical protein